MDPVEIPNPQCLYTSLRWNFQKEIDARYRFHQYWVNFIKSEAKTKKTLRYLKVEAFSHREMHPVWENARLDHFDIVRAQVKAPMLTGRYHLQVDEAKKKEV